MDRDERIAALKRAQELLNEAADIIDSALRMSGLEQRSGSDADAIRRIASDPAYGGSLTSIMLDMERLEDDPIWTQPLTSPKNLFDLSRRG